MRGPEAVSIRASGVKEPRAQEGRVNPRSIRLVRFMRTPSGSVWIILLGFITLGAVFAPYLTSYGPTQMTEFLHPPSTSHWFGTDDLGRDIFTRVLYGARVSLGVAISSMLFAAAIGVPLGLVAGYWGG